MMPLNHILRKCTARYNLSKSQEKINHLMYIDDIKLFVKNEIRMGNPNTDCKNIYSRYRNRKMRHASSEKWQTTRAGKSRTNKSNSNQNARRKGNLQILGNIGSWHHQTSKNERKILKEYLRWTRKLLEIKLYSRNLVKGINTWAVLFIRYSRPFLKWRT